MLGAVLRFIIAALVVLFVAFLFPGFRISGFWTAMLAAALIAVVATVVDGALGRRKSPYAHGLVGLVTGTVVLYAFGALAPGSHVSGVGAVLAGLLIGVVDAFVPVELR